MACRALIIDDRTSFLGSLASQLQALQEPSPRRGSHDDLLADPKAALRDIDVVLLDLLDHGRQQTDHTASRFVAPAIDDALWSSGVAVIAYSTDMHRPEVSVPARELRSIRAWYSAAGLMDNLASAISAPDPAGQVIPAPDERAALGVGPAARVVEALARMQSRPDAWEVLWNPDRSPGKRTTDWIRDAVRPLLDIDARSYLPVVHVLRRVTGLPVRR